MRSRRGQVYGQVKKPIIGVGQKLVLSCNGGKNAYLFNPENGKNTHVVTGSDKFWVVVGDINTAGFGDRLANEFTELATIHPHTPWVGVAGEYATRVAVTDEQIAA